MQITGEPIINIGILLKPCVEFTLKGSFKFNHLIIDAGEYKASISENQLITSFGTYPAIELQPLDSTATFILKHVQIGIGFHWEQMENQEFKGKLKLQIENNEVRAINAVGLETYLQSVISSEMSAMNNLTLLKVHAIVSRSWLLAQIKQQKDIEHQNLHPLDQEKGSGINAEIRITKWYDREDHATYDVCADDHCQRYQGVTKVISNKAREAVDETCGEVLMYGNKICDARFSKCCGGISEDFKNVWQDISVPYLTAISDGKNNKISAPDSFSEFIVNPPEAFCNTTDPSILSQVLIDFDQNTNDFYRWTKTYSQDELRKLIEKKSGLNLGYIIDLVPLSRGASGRIIQLKIIGSEQTVIVGKELEIRKWLSETHLYSSAFLVEKEFDNQGEFPTHFVLKGAGWGHGVGMCQIGAAVMSQKSYSVTDILKHYFNNTTIIKLY